MTSSNSTRLTATLTTLLGMLLCACGGGGGGGGGSSQTTNPPPAPDPAPSTKPFVDATSASGIGFGSGFSIAAPPDFFDRFSESGVASGDYDGDGDIDLFIVRGDIGPNLLYQNDGFGHFVDVAASAGVAFTSPATQENHRLGGPGFADLDGDGDLDLFAGGLFGDPSFVYRNNGDGTFEDVSVGSGVQFLTSITNLSAAFGDYDLDGDLDMLLAHWGTYRDVETPGDTEHLWRNDTDGIGGDIRFTSVSIEAGISPSIINLEDPEIITAQGRDYTFSPSFARINDDLYPDIVMAADYNQSMVFMNDGDADGDGVADGTFTNVTDVGVITDTNGMGSALGDYDDDGDLDWFVTSIFENPDEVIELIPYDGNRLYRNDDGVFVDVTDTAHVREGGWGWGACFIDFENDGDLDIYHTNGWVGDDFLGDASRAFVSDGSGSFSEDASELGLDDTEEGRGVVCADFDDDGDTDILLLHRGAVVAAIMWRNDDAAGNYLKVRLNGRPPNTEAAGARIYATIGDRTMMREIVLGNSYVAQNPTEQIFGLGTFTQLDRLRIEWPDGQVQNVADLSQLQAGQTLEFEQP